MDLYKKESVIDYYINNEEDDIIECVVMGALEDALENRDKNSEILKALLSASFSDGYIEHLFEERQLTPEVK